MHEDIIRWHIERVTEGDDRTERRLRIATRDCWPGGTADRSEPVALHWLRQWRPAEALAALPACSCHAGRCSVCN